MQIQSKNDSLKDPPMFVNTGGGGKGIRPNQHNQQQQQQQAQHHHHQSHHQTQHQQHQQHQPQLQTGSLHQTSSQSAGNSHPHPHQQQGAAPPPHQQQFQHHQLPLSFFPYTLSQIHPQAAGQNSTSNVTGAQLAPSPPTHAGGNGAQGTTMSSGAAAGGGGVGAMASNTAGNAVSSGRQGNTTSTMPHYSGGNPIMQQPANSHFMSPPFMQIQQQNTVMVATQYNNPAVAAAAVAGQHGGNPSAGQTGAILYQQQQAQASATHQQPQIHYQMTAPAGLHHSSHPLRNIMSTRGQYFVLHSIPPQRSSPITNAHQQQTAGSGGSSVHVSTQLQNTGTRGAGTGATPYVQQPFLTPPIQMGAATVMASQTQPLLGSSGIGPPLIQNAFCSLPGAAAPSTSSTSVNLSSISGAGGPASSSTGPEHKGTKPRKHAIPIINPLTMKTVKYEPQSKSSAAIDIKAPTEAEHKPVKTTTVTLTAPPELEKAVKENDKSTTVSVECTTAEPAAQQVDPAAADKIDQQMQTDVIKDNKASTPPLSKPAAMETTQPQCVVSAQTTGIEENDDTDADTPELEHDDDAYGNLSEVIGSSPLQAAATANDNDNTISRDCGNQLPVMDSDDTDQTTETDVKSMSQMDDDNNCSKRLQSEDEHQQKQQIDVDPYQAVASNNVEDTKPEQIPTNVNISVEKSKERRQEVNEANETDDTITIQKKTVASTEEDNVAANTDSNAAPMKTEEPTMSSKLNIPVASSQSNANNNNNINKIQPISVDSNTRNSKSNATPKVVDVPSAAQQQQQQLQQQANDDAFITVSNRKNRKFTGKKNVKENVKKPPHQTQTTQQQSHRMHAAERSNSTTSNNSNSNNRSHNNINNNNTRNMAAPATTVQHHHLTDIHNANSSIASNNNNRSGNKQQQQPSQTTLVATNNNNVNVESSIKVGVNIKDSENNGKHIKSQEIAEQLQQSASPETHDNIAAVDSNAIATASKQDDQKIQFLKNTSSKSEYNEEQQQQQSHKQPELEADAALQNVRFGDLKENEKVLEAENKTVPQTKPRATPDSVDYSSKEATHGRTALTTIPSKPNKVLHVVTPTIQKHSKDDARPFHRYTLDVLKSLAKLPESIKVPAVPCENGDCVSQLFVSQQNKHNSGQSGGGMHMLQPFQQMSFHENMEFIGGKRRSQQRKQHDHQSITSSCGNIAGVGGAAGGSSVGMTGGSVSVTGTSFARPVRMIRVNLSLNEEIKLAESENAWQPSTLVNKFQDAAGGSDGVEATVKKVRGVLNKLTPENFDVLLKTMTSISLDSSEKIHSVMILIFEKTISEPNFAPTYAKFCQVLFNKVKPESKAEFTTSIIKRIQTEFEDNVNMADAKKKTLQPLVDKLKTCTDPKERQEIEAEIEEKEYQFRRRAWGTVRFIGEMYKLNQLTPDRVMICVESLQDHGSEEKLEYMCKLLTTVGHLIDDTVAKNIIGRERMDKVFVKISETIKNTRPNSTGKNVNKITISSRVRFMMQDVIDLRLRHWDQAQSQSQSNASKSAPTVNSGGGGGGGGNSSQHQQRRRNQDEKNNRNNYDRGGSSQRMGYGGSNSQRQNRMDRDGGGGNNYYSKNSQKSNFQQEDKLIDFKKFSFSKTDDSSSDTQLGNSLTYKWRVCGKPAVGPMQNATAPPMSGMSSAGSQRYGLSGNNSNSSNNNVKRQTNQFHELSPKESDAERPSASSSCNEESDVEEKTISVKAANDYKKQINEFVADFLECAPDNRFDWQSNALITWRSNVIKQQVEMLYYLLIDYLHLREVSKVERSACAAVFLYLLRTKAFDKKIFARAYDQFAEEFPDVLVDVPAGWTYVFEFLGPLLHDRLLNFEDIWRDLWNDDKSFTERFVKAFVVHFTKEFGANYVRDLWHKEYNLDVGQVFIADQKKCSDFFASQGLKFLFDDNAKPLDDYTSRSTPEEQKIKRLEVLLKGGNNCDLAIDYINTNVNINSSFIKILTHFLCCDYATAMTPSSGSSSSTKKAEDARKTPQLNMETFRKCCHPLLRRCFDAQEEFEVICLDTVYESMQKNHDSKTASEFTWKIFDALYECEVIAKESIDKWYKKHNSRGGQLTPQLQAYLQKIL